MAASSRIVPAPACRSTGACLVLAIAGILSCEQASAPRLPSAATSAVTLSAPIVPSGQSISVTLQVRDDRAVDLATAGLVVTFALGAGSSTGSFGPVTDGGDCSYSSVFTGILAGTPREIVASIGGTDVADRPAVTVIPGDASPATSVVEAAATSVPVCAGVTVTLRARDAAGNAVTTGGRQVLFTMSGGSGSLGPSFDHGDGTYTATFTATVQGSVTIGATLDGAPVTSALPTIQVTPIELPDAFQAVPAATGLPRSGEALRCGGRPRFA